MKQKLLKLALCAMALLPLGVFATTKLSGVQTLTFNDFTTQQYKAAEGQSYNDGTYLSLWYGNSDTRAITITASSLTATLNGVDIDVTKVVNLNGIGEIATDNAIYKSKRRAGDTSINSALGGTIALNVNTPGTLYIYAKGATSAVMIAAFQSDTKSGDYYTCTNTEISLTTSAAQYTCTATEAGGFILYSKTKAVEIQALYFVPFTTVNIGVTGYATFGNTTGVHLTPESGLTAYKAKPSANSVTLTALDGIPQTAGVVIKGTPNTTYKLHYAASGTTYTAENNYMVRVTSDSYTLPQTEEYNSSTRYNYILINDDGSAKFFKTDGTSVLAKGKAYFRSTTDYSAALSRGIGIEFEDGTTNISVAKDSNRGDGKWYTLQGVEVKEPTKGIYIKNGKKVIVK